MEALAYTHSYAAYEQAAGIEYDLPETNLNWQGLPNAAWLGFLGVAFLAGSLSIASPASAALYVKTNGSCLKARTGPGTGYRVVTCVRNGAKLANPVGYSGNWIKLATGRWVNASWTSLTPGGPRGYISSNGNRSRPTRGGSVVLDIGARGSLVRSVQSRLGVAVDGSYGPQTKAAVRRFQRANNLLADGIVGPATRGALGL